MRAAWAVLGAAAILGTARLGVAPPEHCPAVEPGDARAAVERAVAWLAGGQSPDGMFTYALDDEGNDLGGYNVVRHAGVVLSLEQATTAGVAGAEDAAERGRAWAIDHLVAAGGGQALAELDGSARTGASALFVRALLERREATGSTEDDDLLAGLGRFLQSQVVDEGAVSSLWDPSTDAPVPGRHDRFFTGQVLWALDGLAAEGLDGGAAATAALVGDYLPRRDDLEGFFPPVSDHWGAYAYDGLGLDRLTPAQLAHARRVAGIIGVQVRGEATRWKGGLVGALRGGEASGSGLATLGEGGAALLRLLGEDGAPGLSARVRCTAGMLVARQATDGAWYRDGTTRMDDQQHSISALLAAAPVLAGGDDAVGGGEQRHSAVWLLVAAAVTVGLLGGGRTGSVPVGRTLAATVALVVLSGPVLDALDISPASARVAAGVALGMAALATGAASEAIVTGGVAVAAAGVVALALGADDGWRALAVLAVVLIASVAVPKRWRGPVGARAIAIVALLVAADLVVDGVMGV